MLPATAPGGRSHSAGAVGALTCSTLISGGMGKTRSARSYWRRRSATVNVAGRGRFARCARTASMPRSAMWVLLGAKLNLLGADVAEWRRDASDPRPVSAHVPLRDRLEGRAHVGHSAASRGRAVPA